MDDFSNKKNLIINYTTALESNEEVNSQTIKQLLLMCAFGHDINILSGRDWATMYQRSWKKFETIAQDPIVIQAVQKVDPNLKESYSWSSFFSKRIKFFAELGAMQVNPFTGQKTIEDWLRGKLDVHLISQGWFRKQIKTLCWNNDMISKNGQKGFFWKEENPSNDSKGDHLIPNDHTIKIDGNGGKIVMPIFPKDFHPAAIFPDLFFNDSKVYMLTAEILREPDGSIADDVQKRISKSLEAIRKILEVRGYDDYIDVSRASTALDFTAKIDGLTINKSYGAGRIIKNFMEAQGISKEQACANTLIIGGSPHDIEASEPIIDKEKVKDPDVMVKVAWLGSKIPEKFSNSKNIQKFGSLDEIFTKICPQIRI